MIMKMSYQNHIYNHLLLLLLCHTLSLTLSLLLSIFPPFFLLLLRLTSSHLSLSVSHLCPLVTPFLLHLLLCFPSRLPFGISTLTAVPSVCRCSSLSSVILSPLLHHSRPLFHSLCYHSFPPLPPPLSLHHSPLFQM